MEKHPNIQIRLNENCDQVFFLFNGAAENAFMPPLKFFNETRLLDRNLVMFRDKDRKFYMNGVGEGIDSFLQLLEWQKAFLKEQSLFPDKAQPLKEDPEL